MNKLRKKLYSRKGQSVVEYLVLFSIISLITFITLSGFLPEVKDFAGDVFRTALDRLKG